MVCGDKRVVESAERYRPRQYSEPMLGENKAVAPDHRPMYHLRSSLE
jgi:hypothetical protein